MSGIADHKRFEMVKRHQPAVNSYVAVISDDYIVRGPGTAFCTLCNRGFNTASARTFKSHRMTLVHRDNLAKLNEAQS